MWRSAPQGIGLLSLTAAGKACFLIFADRGELPRRDLLLYEPHNQDPFDPAAAVLFRVWRALYKRRAVGLAATRSTEAPGAFDVGPDSLM